MTSVEAGDLLLVRFSPMNVRGFIEDAEDSADDCETRGEPRVYSISAFGLVKTMEQTVDDLVLQICQEAPCNGRNVWLAVGSVLTRTGFRVLLSEPPPHHYDVILGSELRIPDVERLVKHFEPGRQRNPAWKRRRS